MYCLPLLKRAVARVWPVLALLAFSLTMAQAADAPKKAAKVAKTAPEAAGARVVFTNFLGQSFVAIPSGSFVMGSCRQDKKAAFLGQDAGCLAGRPDDEASDYEAPQHRVSVSAFQMGQTEVTLGQFKKYIAATGRTGLVDEGFMKANDSGDSAPVVNVSWHDAQGFIGWLNGAKPDSDQGTYRLPSEAEWEYACRAGGYHRYCGSDSASEVAYYGQERGGPLSVARKKPNAWGLYDMSGNVLEWVEDCWHDNYYGAPTDGSAWTSGCKPDGRGLRGGSWSFIARLLRAAYRGNGSPGDRFNYIGFRLARTR